MAWQPTSFLGGVIVVLAALVSPVAHSGSPTAPARCVRSSGALQQMATAVKQATTVETARLIPGLQDENTGIGAIVLANFDGFGPMVDFDNHVLANLPEGIRAYMLVPTHSTLPDQLRSQHPDADLRVVRARIDTNWARDFVPEAVVGPQGGRHLVRFNYPHKGARQSGAALSDELGIPVVTSPLVLDGGNILGDPENSRVLLTERTLNANPTWSKSEIEREIRTKLGVSEVIWLPQLPQEGTGHIDMFAKRLPGNVMLVSSARDPDKKAMLNAAARQLKDLHYPVERIEIAGRGDGFFIPTYTNSVIINDTALVPTYKDAPAENWARVFAKADAKALEQYRSMGLKVVPVPCYWVLIQGGAAHCMIKQIPKTFLPE